VATNSPRDAEALAKSASIGPLLESFVVQQIRSQLGWSEVHARAHHFRTPVGREVDIVLEAPGGRVVGIEVKASATFNRRDFAGLEALAEVAGDRFVRGVLFHLGDQIVPVGPRMVAMPVASLWSPMIR